MWLGWIVSYGSFVMAGVFAAAALVVGSVIVPREDAVWRAGPETISRVSKYHTPVARNDKTIEANDRIESYQEITTAFSRSVERRSQRAIECSGRVRGARKP
jgi:hypothetical protein